MTIEPFVLSPVEAWKAQSSAPFDKLRANGIAPIFRRIRERMRDTP